MAFINPLDRPGEQVQINQLKAGDEFMDSVPHTFRVVTASPVEIIVRHVDWRNGVLGGTQVQCEIAEAVKDNFAGIHFDALEDVRMMSQDQVCARINGHPADFSLVVSQQSRDKVDTPVH